MNWLVCLLVLATALEGLVCGGLLQSRRLQRLGVVLAGGLLAGTVIGLCIGDWQVWAWGVPAAAYRLVNLLRVCAGRLPAPRLRRVALGAFRWLVIGQAAVTGLAWLVVRHRWGYAALDVLVVVQLLGALTLLRATLHTWRHATVSRADAKPLTDRELPAVSVLVPARNETEDLQRCLELLTASDYPKLEVLVLDDCSATRRTPEIIRSFAHAGVRFVPGEVPDETRWLAKNYAYEQLARAASGDVLLFCGVDALLEPQSIRRLVELLEARGKNMLSVMPLRRAGAGRGNSILQAMRYYWEICPPRRLFKRPPVLSTCWLIRRQTLKDLGGFESVSRSVTPEAPLARQVVTTDGYSFVRSDPALGVYSNKPAAEQYSTSVRVRYPQLHRRLELVALAALFELALLLGPLLGLTQVGRLRHALAYAAVWTVSLLCLLITYGLVAAGARLTGRWYSWLLLPVACAADLAVLHVSLWRYEFGSVEWKGRNVCIPVMQVQPAQAGRS